MNEQAVGQALGKKAWPELRSCRQSVALRYRVSRGRVILVRLLIPADAKHLAGGWRLECDIDGSFGASVAASLMRRIQLIAVVATLPPLLCAQDDANARFQV